MATPWKWWVFCVAQIENKWPLPYTILCSPLKTNGHSLRAFCNLRQKTNGHSLKGMSILCSPPLNQKKGNWPTLIAFCAIPMKTNGHTMISFCIDLPPQIKQTKWLLFNNMPVCICPIISSVHNIFNEWVSYISQTWYGTWLHDDLFDLF